MINRRKFLSHAGAVSVTGIAGSLATVKNVQAADYKALIVVFLSGGFDGNNVLIPVDGAYGDYQTARPSLALPKDSLVRLQGTHLGHQFSLSPAMRPLAALFEQQRLAVVANVGALVQPTTIQQIRDRTAKLPPFMGSHTEQEQWIQGWMGDENLSGWGGRSLDMLAPEMRSKQPLIALARDYTAVLGNTAPLSLGNSNGSSNWRRAQLGNPDDVLNRQVDWASRLQSGNEYEAEFARSLRSAYLDSLEFAKGQQYGSAPVGNFPDQQVGRDLRFVARHIPFSKQTGARRQVYLVQDGGYDTHAGQLSADGLETHLSAVANSLVAFDDSIKAAGISNEVITVVMSEFGRTLDPASGGGSDHAWGNHWFVLGGPVKGGVIYGKSFPTLQTGGPDDASDWNPKRGQWVPQFSSDQFIADAARWMGLSAEQALAVMPNLNNFQTNTVGYI